jgi:TRAP-type C4-dicarboxylate transport system permease small subunit
VYLPVHAASPSMGFSTRWVKLSIAVGAILMTLFTLSEIARDLVALRRGDRKHFDRLAAGGEL